MDHATSKNQKSYDARAEDWHAAMDSNFGHKYLEKPAIISQLPKSLEGKTVLCIGVGSGEELEILLELNSSKIVGIDISTKLLGIAASHFPQVAFHKMDMTQMALPDDTFDVVYSSLTFHYAKDWDRLLAGVNRVLKKGGTLLFSTHNPDYWGSKPATGKSHTNRRGKKVLEHQDVLPGGVEITYYNHKNRKAIEEAVEHAGFAIKHTFTPRIVEADTTGMSPADAEAYNSLKAKNEKTPLFFVVHATKG